MSKLLPKRPYLLRAMHEWISECGNTPHVIVDAGNAINVGRPGQGNGAPTNPDDKPYADKRAACTFKQGALPESRPVTFLFNGGPGSATVWLHMGAFGPKRVVTPSDASMPTARLP